VAFKETLYIATIFIYIDNFNFDGSDIFSCDADHLTLYNNTYKPVFNPKLRFDGYYTYRDKSFEIPMSPGISEEWPNW
jgi:hypothetical protein